MHDILFLRKLLFLIKNQKMKMKILTEENSINTSDNVTVFPSFERYILMRNVNSELFMYTL